MTLALVVGPPNNFNPATALLNESGLRYFSLLSKLFTSYHLSIYKNSSLNTAHLASSDPLMLCYLNVILTISRPMAQERLEWQHRNYGTSFRGNLLRFFQKESFDPQRENLLGEDSICIVNLLERPRVIVFFFLFT